MKQVSKTSCSCYLTVALKAFRHSAVQAEPPRCQKDSTNMSDSVVHWLIDSIHGQYYVSVSECLTQFQFRRPETAALLNMTWLILFGTSEKSQKLGSLLLSFG